MVDGEFGGDFVRATDVLVEFCLVVPRIDSRSPISLTRLGDSARLNWT